MNIKDIICPYCGRPNIFSSLNWNSYQIMVDLEEDIINKNFNENINNTINFDFDFKFRPNTSETKITSVNTTYSIDKFDFFVTKGKKSTNIFKNDKIELINNYKKVKGPKKLGRKIKRNNEFTLEDGNSIKDNNNNKKVHDKFSDDNMRKKCKNVIRNNLLEFINNKINIVYNNDIGHGLSGKKLKILKQKTKSESTVSSDREFMNKKLKEIFSQDISSRFCNYSLNHNEKVINSLINEKDEVKRDYFDKLFNLTFMDCLTFFRGDKYFEELEGLKNLESVKQDLMIENGEEYANHFVYYIKNYEDIINKKSKKFLKSLKGTINN